MKILFYLILIISCNSNRNERQENLPKEKFFINDHYDTILKALEKNYVLNFNTNNKSALFRFYNIDEAVFTRDSMLYFEAVSSFFSSDSTLIDYLFSFRQDTTHCSWLYTSNPYSSVVKSWELDFEKKQGVVVLIHDYLTSFTDGVKEITSDPDEIEKIISIYKIEDLESWYRNFNGPLLKKGEILKESFKSFSTGSLKK